MSVNRQYVNVDYIIENIRKEFGFDEIDRADIREYIGDTIGYAFEPATFEEKYATIDIEDFRGILPPDFYSIQEGAIIEEDTSIPFTDNPDLFSRFVTDTDFRNSDDVDTEKYVYEIKEDYIYCGIEDTTLLMAYKAFPVDDNGEPKVPDDAKVIRSVTHYCAERLAFKLYLKDILSKDKYQEIQQQALFAGASAHTRLKMPTLDQLERMKNRAMSLLQHGNMHDNNFRNLGSREKYANTSTSTTTTTSSDTDFDYFVDANGDIYVDANNNEYY